MHEQLPVILRKSSCFIISAILILNLRCNKVSKTELNNIYELDSKKTIELLNQIHKDKNYLSISCISEKPRAVYQPMVSDFDKYIKDLLKINDTIHFKRQSELYKKFKITPKLFPDKNIITEKQFEEFSVRSKKGGFSFWDWLEKNCKNGYYSISKPFFNETSDLAYIQFGVVHINGCGHMGEMLYVFDNGIWRLIKEY